MLNLKNGFKVLQRIAVLTVFITAFGVFGTGSAHAETCSSNYSTAALNAKNTGLVTAIMSNIVVLLEKVGKELFDHIIKHPYYTSALSAVILLMVVIYGTMIVFDLENLKPGVILLKMFKIGLVAWLASPSGWELFSETMAKFFFETMVQLVNLFLQGAAGITAGANPSLKDPSSLAEPLQSLGYPIAMLFSAKFGITLLGLFWLGGYGFVAALIMIWAGFNLLLTVFQALFVYIKCIVGLWFMFALAPIFFICLLFQRTSNLFTGWLNMVINFTLQPILMFAFLAFYIVMIVSSLNSLMQVEWCKKELNLYFFGLPFPVELWRPTIVNGHKIDPYWDWDLFGLSQNYTHLQFPLDLVDILFFLLSSYLAMQYGKFVPQLANQLSQGGVSVGVSAEEARQFFQSRGWLPEQIAVKGVRGTWNTIRAATGALAGKPAEEVKDEPKQGDDQTNQAGGGQTGDQSGGQGADPATNRTNPTDQQTNRTGGQTNRTQPEITVVDPSGGRTGQKPSGKKEGEYIDFEEVPTNKSKPTSSDPIFGEQGGANQPKALPSGTVPQQGSGGGNPQQKQLEPGPAPMTKPSVPEKQTVPRGGGGTKGGSGDPQV